MISLDKRLALAFLATVASRVIFHHLTGFIADDAFITFRYAENLAAGNGFVYNVGERVLGTTTPLFTLILATLNLLGLPIPSAALFVSLIASGLTGVVIYRFALSLRFTTLAWLPVLGYMLWPRSLPVDTSGMETALFTLLTTAAFYYQHKRQDIYALATATLSALTRPEGFGVVLLLLAWNCYQKPHNWRGYLSVAGLLILPWIVFATVYFGSPIPNSVAAKAALYGKLGMFGVWETFVYFLGWHTPFGWLMTALAIPGAWWLNRRQNFGWLEIVWLIGLVLFYSLGRARMFFWYVGPIYPLYFLFVTAAFCLLVERLKLVAKKRLLAGWLIGIGMAVSLLYGCYKPLIYFGNLQKDQMAAHYEVGVYLNAKADPEAVVAAEDIGYMGYYSKRVILDRDGIISPEVIPYNRDGRYYDLIVDLEPDWLVTLRTSPLSQFYDKPWFVESYDIQTSFASDKFVYDIFKRNTDQFPEIENLQPQ